MKTTLPTESLSPSNSEAILRRARSMIGERLNYVLGAGGRNPRALTPASTITVGGLERTGCDCSGFVAWVLGYDRYQPDDFDYMGGWISTDGMLGKWDKTKECWTPDPDWFELLEAPTPGCLVVYGAVDLDHDGQKERIGHVGIVSHCDPVWSHTTNRVIHCSAQRVKPGFAVQETNGEVWKRAALVRGRHHKRFEAVFLRPLKVVA